MPSSLEQGGIFNSQTNNIKSGNTRQNRYKKQANQYNVIESFSSNSNGAINPSTTSTASSSKAPSIPANYQYKNIKRVNTAENNVMDRVVKDVDTSVNKAIMRGKDTTTVANIFLNSNDKNSYKNSNVSTVNGVLGNVNAMGIFSSYGSNVNSNDANFTQTDLNIPASKALAINQNAQYPIITSGTLNSSTSALLGQPAQVSSVSAQNNIAQYAGQNVYTYDRNPLLGSNISYQNNYTTNLSLALNSDMGSNVTAKQCFERAADTAGGYSSTYAAINNSGECYTGVSRSENQPLSYSETITLCEVFQGVTITNNVIVFGANGGLYNGMPTSSNPQANLLNTNLASDILTNVDPMYGAYINNVNASYGLSDGMANSNNMLFQDSVVNATNPTGESVTTFGTVRTTISQQQTCPDWMNWPWYQWLFNTDYGRNAYCQTEETVTYSDIHNAGEGQDVTLTYNCGRMPMSLPAQNVSEGTQVSINCLGPISQYGIFSLQIADNGLVTITNSAGTPGNEIVWSFTPTSAEQTALNQSLPLQNMTTVPLNAPRPDWVQQSGITQLNPTNYTTILYTYPNGYLASFTPGEFLSSPSGICRLILNENLQFVIEYSLYNIALDSSNYAVGNIANAASPNDESYALYLLDNIQANNVGNLSYVDMNNNVYTYNQPQNGYPLGDSYIKSNNYKPVSSPLSVTQNTSSDKCSIICSNDTNCGGYYIDNNSNCLTYTQSSLYPYANRIYDDSNNLSTYVRDVKVTQDMTDPSCSKLVANITNDIYNDFGGYITGAPMLTDKKCGMAVILDNEIQSLNKANANAIAKGQTIKNQMTNIYKKQNQAIDDLQLNNMFSNMFEDVIQDVDNAIKTKEENALTKVAARNNTDILLVSDNYKYIIWGIVTLLLSIGAIKALRMGSS